MFNKGFIAIFPSKEDRNYHHGGGTVMKKSKAGDKKERAKGTRLLDSKFWVDPMSGPMRVIKEL